MYSMHLKTKSIYIQYLSTNNLYIQYFMHNNEIYSSFSYSILTVSSQIPVQNLRPLP